MPFNWSIQGKYLIVIVNWQLSENRLIDLIVGNAEYTNILTFHGQELQHDTSLKLVDLAQADAAGNRDMAA